MVLKLNATISNVNFRNIPPDPILIKKFTQKNSLNTKKEAGPEKVIGTIDKKVEKEVGIEVEKIIADKKEEYSIIGAGTVKKVQVKVHPRPTVLAALTNDFKFKYIYRFFGIHQFIL